MLVHFYVTQKDINHGARQDCSLCPVARAVKRKFPDKEVRVYPDIVYIGEKHYPTTHKIAAFIFKFDTYGPNDRYVGPFRFTLEVE